MTGVLNHSPAEITLELLIEETLGYRVSDASPVDWMVFLNTTRNEKYVSTSDFLVDKTITVYDTQGIVGDRVQFGVYPESHGVQIALRLNEYEERVGYLKAKSIQDHLDLQINRKSLTIDSTNYLIHSYSRSSDIVRVNNVSKDDHTKGLMFTLNLLIFVTKV